MLVFSAGEAEDNRATEAGKFRRQYLGAALIGGYVKNSQVIGPRYMQQRLLICPRYVDSVPELKIYRFHEKSPIQKQYLLM